MQLAGACPALSCPSSPGHPRPCLDLHLHPHPPPGKKKEKRKKRKGTLHFTPSPFTLSLSTTNDMLQIHSFLPREACDSVNHEYSHILHRRPDNSPTLAVPGAAPSGTPSTSILESAVRRSPGRSPTWLNHSRTHPPHIRAHTTLAAALPDQCFARRIPHLAICHSRHETPDERSLVRG